MIWSPLFTVLRRDLLLALRRRSEVLRPLLFLLLIITIFPLAIGPSPAVLMRVGPGIVWAAALLACLLSLDALFRPDFEDGSFEQMLLSPHPLPLMLLGKALAHWLLTGAVVTLASPLLAHLLFLGSDTSATLLKSLALGTPVLSLIGTIGMALTVGLPRGGMLLGLLVLPLFVPVLIFGAGAVEATASGLPAVGQLKILGALLAASLVLTPFAAAAAIRISID